METIHNDLIDMLGKDKGELAFRFLHTTRTPVPYTKVPKWLLNAIYGLDNSPEFAHLSLRDRRLISFARDFSCEWNWTFEVAERCESEEARAIVEKINRDDYYRNKDRY